MGFSKTRGSSTQRSDNLTLCRQLISFWDESGDPKDISDLGKLFGTGIGTRGTAIVKTFLAGSRTTKLADGYHGTKTHAMRQMNPLNFVLRLHTKEGRGVESAWGIRRVTDHQHKDFERRNLSTTVLNACDRVVWAWDHDLERVVTVRGKTAKLTDKELHFSDSGHLPAMSGKGKGNTTRGLRTLNVDKRGGSFSDGKLIAGIWHVLHLGAKGGAVTTPTKTKGRPTVTSNRIGRPTVTGECAVVDEADGLLRGDVEFAVLAKKAHLAIVDKVFPKTFGDPLVGHLFIDPVPLALPPSKELDKNPLSNQVELLRRLHQSLRVVVFQERPWVPSGPRVPVPPDFPDVPTPTHKFTIAQDGAFPTEEYRTSGQDVGSNTLVPIPEDLPSGKGLNFSVNFIVQRGLGFFGDIDMRIDYVVSPIAGRTDPIALTGTIGATVNATTHPPIVNQSDGRANFFIPASDLKGAEGGKISIAFYRSGSDDQLDVLKVTEMPILFAQEVF